MIEADPEIAHWLPDFVARRRQDVRTILQALIKGDYESIRAMGYMLKGAGGAYDCEEISEIGHRLQEAAVRKNSVDIREEVIALSDYLNRAIVVPTVNVTRDASRGQTSESPTRPA